MWRSSRSGGGRLQQVHRLQRVGALAAVAARLAACLGGWAFRLHRGQATGCAHLHDNSKLMALFRAPTRYRLAAGCRSRPGQASQPARQLPRPTSQTPSCWCAYCCQGLARNMAPALRSPAAVSLPRTQQPAWHEGVLPLLLTSVRHGFDLVRSFTGFSPTTSSSRLATLAGRLPRAQGVGANVQRQPSGHRPAQRGRPGGIGGGRAGARHVWRLPPLLSLLSACTTMVDPL